MLKTIHLGEVFNRNHLVLICRKKEEVAITGEECLSRDLWLAISILDSRMNKLIRNTHLNWNSLMYLTKTIISSKMINIKTKSPTTTTWQSQELLITLSPSLLFIQTTNLKNIQLLLLPTLLLLLLKLKINNNLLQLLIRLNQLTQTKK